MKLVRFGSPGAEKPGLVDADGRIRDLSAVVPDIGGPVLSRDGLARLRDLSPADLPLAPEGVRLGACVAGTGNFIAVGLNYADHAAESGMAVPSEPVLFNKAPSCIVGPDDTVLLPPGSTKSDWEVELAVVIGERASYVSEAEALDHVAGYCVCNDVSEREYQLERGGQWTKGKGCPTFGPLGPWLVTKDEIGDVQDLRMTLAVNGETVQDGSTRTMVFQVPFLVSYISRFMALMPGDVITTGTPPGVGMGMKPPRYLRGGDRMRVEIQGLGAQQQRVSAG
ncbi:Fumarylacetoacetate hydrolase family protein [Roseomonas mucosa]|uniref:2-hydroxyhepta-2,4-diene-1,7-dioate isomerase n=1 Tax=Roseomonas mucosa TaxID=207340 RepID=A0A1S8D598_9PROT|nr:MULTISPECIES: fumarylacetoacetate hydrolase family protein [Roseomonas]MBS5902667.1 fumarylacetoacetate hydrolase family protein [Acetobacteraceae bacterium]MDT8267412.1 fumarylacetoacetate hydrolase family protein [Roseomonas sp. DSM 102946]ATR21474.1 FAA hydrolase family protein [Roseomonas sp. FDAARGOS_362]AWV21903.1 Fumarylacetoacetate hydrolase family protein [Roseomonas mucosa]MCG7351945.1 fumarylacetoacetate hydrolase family protein [Roseomonas mucosa]